MIRLKRPIFGVCVLFVSSTDTDTNMDIKDASNIVCVLFLLVITTGFYGQCSQKIVRVISDVTSRRRNRKVAEREKGE